MAHHRGEILSVWETGGQQPQEQQQQAQQHLQTSVIAGELLLLSLLCRKGVAVNDKSLFVLHIMYNKAKLFESRLCYSSIP